MAKNDIEHITNEIAEFILITFDELKLNYKTLLWNVKQILQNDNWKQFLVCGNKYNPKKSHIHCKDGFSFKAQPNQESKYNNYTNYWEYYHPRHEKCEGKYLVMNYVFTC